MYVRSWFESSLSKTVFLLAAYRIEDNNDVQSLYQPVHRARASITGSAHRLI